MSRKYFGTDGIRGKANVHPMTAEMVMKIAMATAATMRDSRNENHQNRVIIGKDTRLSGYMLEQAMAAGFIAMGMEVLIVGPIPTPGIAMLTRSLRADIGVMISASHNHYQDNGIKLFGHNGFKLDDDVEDKIETALENGLESKLSPPDKLGKASRLDDALGRYAEFLKASLPRWQVLDGLKVVIDCANGAGYKIAPQLLWELEAEVIPIGTAPNGKNINDGYGATSPENLRKAVIDNKAHIGLALDGDADRVIMVDEQGNIIDGDQIMAALADHWSETGTLRNKTVVSTVMSNLGLEKYLESKGIELKRTKVGDRYVVEQMQKEGHNLGGEQSGHIIMTDYGTTGDGLMAALQAMSILKTSAQPASVALKRFDPFPQCLENIQFNPGSPNPLENERIMNCIEKINDTLGEKGRIVVRASGTEPVIRVMGEAENETLLKNAVNTVSAEIRNFNSLKEAS